MDTQPEASGSWRPHLRLITFAAAVLLGIAAVGTAALTALTLRPGPAIDGMVPASADVYATVYLDPPIGQKLNLLKLAHKFPDLKTDRDIDKKVDEILDQGLKEADLSFGKDVRPWLGTRLGLVVQLADGTPWVLLIAARDESKARAALAKARDGASARRLVWREETYRGVLIASSIHTSGSPTGNVKEGIAYAHLHHTVVLGNAEALLRDVVDADQGKKPRLVDSAGYKSAISRLPAERLALAYVNGKRAGDRLRELPTTPFGSGLLMPRPGMDQLNAFKSVGFAVSAMPNGLSGDLEIDIDAGKLDRWTRTAVGTAPRKNRVLEWIPQHAYGVYALTTLKPIVQSFAEQALASDGSARHSLDQYGLTGPNGVIAHLTGDAGLEVGPGSGDYPAGAVLIGTDDARGMRALLNQLAAMVVPFLSGASLTRETYRGVEISSLSGGGLVPAFAPAYTVTGGFGIVASTQQELKAIIDAHESGQNITVAERFLAAGKTLHDRPDVLVYVDIAAGASALRRFYPDQDEWDLRIAPQVAPVSAALATARSSRDHLSQRTFVLIE